MIVHSTCGSQIVSYYLILKLSITASLYGSKVYIGMYIPDCMISFYYNQ